MFTDTSRIQGESLFTQEQMSSVDSRVIPRYMPDTSLSYLGILLVLLGLGLGLTASSVILDKKDISAYSKKLQSSMKFNLLK